MHELIRQYAAEQLGHTPASVALYARHAAYYCDFLVQHVPDLAGTRPLEAAQVISSEDENLHAAWHYAVHTRHASVLEQATDSLGAYYEWQSYRSEGEAAFRAAHAWGEREAVPEHLRLRARLAAWLAVFCSSVDPLSEALGLFARSLELLNAAAALGEDVRASAPSPSGALARCGRTTDSARRWPSSRRVSACTGRSGARGR